ncbi:MAG: L,D-transpeptidase family protein [Campylobacterales bacterium]|nr:L,D-transpeptidase family protein [Campylobacterales bacterium]
MKALFYTLFVLSIVALALFLTKEYWYKYYQKCFEPPKISKFEPKIILQEPKVSEVSSERKLKHSLADSDFIIYPKRITLIAIKNSAMLEVWGEKQGKMVYIASFPFSACSGRLGPKLQHGDHQIPEGIYAIEYLNPNSQFHLSMKISYPNSFDKKIAKMYGIANMGGDIMIHGGCETSGCIPLGDYNIEQLYFLAQKVGIKNIKVIIAPVDFREGGIVKYDRQKFFWLDELYEKLREELKIYKQKG